MGEKESAPVIPIGNKKFFCVEYPGVVRRTKRAIQTLGGEQMLSQALAGDLPVNLWFRPEDPFSHPVQSRILKTTKLVAKVTRRVKRNRATGEIIETEKDWKIEVTGFITNVVRFRNLADVQHIVPKDNDILQLKHSLNVGDAKSLINFEFLSETKDPGYGLRNIPPPLFSTRQVPVDYGYRQNRPVMRVKVKQPDGTYKIGLINRDRRTTLDITYVNFDSKTIPTESWQLIKPTDDPLIIEGRLIVKELFEKRPVWSRLAMKAQMDPKYHKQLVQILVKHAYIFATGPFRECWVKYGIDPRTNQDYYLYQFLSPKTTQKIEKPIGKKAPKFFTKNGMIKSTERISSEQKTNESDGPRETIHIFDGVTYRGNSGYQICDFTDPQLSSIIHNRAYMKEECAPRTGYYCDWLWAYVRELMKQKNELIKQNLPTEVTILSDEAIREEIKKELEKESEKNKMLVAEKAISEAKTQMEEPDSSKKLKESVDSYIEEFDKSENEYINADGEDSDLELSDTFDEYDEEFDVFRDEETNENLEENEDKEDQLEDMEVDTKAETKDNK